MRWMVIALLGLSTWAKADEIDIAVSSIVYGNQYATHRTVFETEGPENAVRVELYELNVTRALGVQELPEDFEQKLPLHFKNLIGKRIRVTGKVIPIKPSGDADASMPSAGVPVDANEFISITPRQGVEFPVSRNIDLVGDLRVKRVRWQGRLRSVFALEDAINPELDFEIGVITLPKLRNGVLSDYYRSTGFLVIATPVENSSPVPSRLGVKQQRFRIRNILSNPSDLLKVDQVVEAPHRPHLKSQQLVILGTDKEYLKYQLKSDRPPTWLEPVDISESQATYMAGLSSSQTDSIQRTSHLIKALDTQDPRILADAYGQLRKTPGKQVEQVKSLLDRAKLRAWLDDPIAQARPYLYVRLLGHCGNADDAAFLKSRISKSWKKGYFRGELEGYLILVGDEGLPFVEQAADAKYFPWCPIGIESLQVAWGVNNRLTREATLKVVLQFLDKEPDVTATAIRMLAVLGDWSQTRNLIERYHAEKKMKEGAIENPTAIHWAIVDFAAMAEASHVEGQNVPLHSIEARNFLQKLSAENRVLQELYEEKRDKAAKGQLPWEY